MWIRDGGVSGITLEQSDLEPQRDVLPDGTALALMTVPSVWARRPDAGDDRLDANVAPAPSGGRDEPRLAAVKTLGAWRSAIVIARQRHQRAWSSVTTPIGKQDDRNREVHTSTSRPDMKSETLIRPPSRPASLRKVV